MSGDGTSVYVGGELGGLIHLSRNVEDGSLAMTHTWMASDFDEAIEVRAPGKQGGGLRSDRGTL